MDTVPGIPDLRRPRLMVEGFSLLHPAGGIPHIVQSRNFRRARQQPIPRNAGQFCFQPLLRFGPLGGLGVDVVPHEEEKSRNSFLEPLGLALASLDGGRSLSAVENPSGNSVART
jgi:hypothetical protein